MEGIELKEFVEDVKKNGLLKPILLYEGKILDGRNRYNACKELGIEPKYKEFKITTMSPLDYVESMNIRRRQLNSDQRLIYEFKKKAYIEELEEEAKKRQDQSLILERSEKGQFKEKLPVVSQRLSSGEINKKKRAPQTRDIIAHDVKVSNKKVQKAKKLLNVAKENPSIEEKIKEIQKGKTTINIVYNEIFKKEGTKAKIEKNKECKNCGKEFKLTTPNKIFCSQECANRYRTFQKKKTEIERTEKEIEEQRTGEAKKRADEYQQEYDISHEKDFEQKLIETAKQTVENFNFLKIEMYSQKTQDKACKIIEELIEFLQEQIKNKKEVIIVEAK